MTEQREGKDSELKRILHTSIIELMAAGGASAYWTAYYISDEYPDLAEQFGFEQIKAIADEMLRSELPELSLRFQRMFAEFNEMYFAGGLPVYTVKVMYDAGWVRLRNHPWLEEPTSGVINSQDKLIRIRADESERSMVEILVHEMAHAATDGYHGFKWTLEMVRLRDAGAPIDPTSTWGVGGRVWRVIERAGVGRPCAHGEMDNSEEQRLLASCLSPEEIHLLTALRMIGPNRSLEQIEAVAVARKLNERHRRKRNRHRRTAD